MDLNYGSEYEDFRKEVAGRRGVDAENTPRVGLSMGGQNVKISIAEWLGGVACTQKST